MAYFIRPVLSVKASEEMAFALANKVAITFTRLALGSGKHTSDLETKTNVQSPSVSIPALQSLEATEQIRVSARLDNRNVSSTLFVREIGVFAKVGNRPEFMFLYTYSDDADVIPPGTDASVIRDYTFNTRIDSSGELEIQYAIGEDVYAKYTEVVKVENDLLAHIDDKMNPHNTTKSHVGLGNVDNVQQAPLTDFKAHKNGINPHGINKATLGLNNVDNVQQAPLTDFKAHKDARNNPHNTTKVQVGLGNVDNYATATQAEATAGVATNKFLTPFLAKLAIEALMPNKMTSGNNTNGTWVRFDSGLQITYSYVDMPGENTITHHFPIDFNDFPLVLTDIQDWRQPDPNVRDIYRQDWSHSVAAGKRVWRDKVWIKTGAQYVFNDTKIWIIAIGIWK